MTEKRKKRRNNVSRKGGMYKRIFPKNHVHRPLKPYATSMATSMATTTDNHPLEFLVMPDKTVELHKMTTNEKSVIEDGIKFIKTTFEAGGKTEMFKLGWEEEYRKMVINLYSQVIKSNTQNGGMITETGITRKPKFSVFNYRYILISIIFGIASIMIMASLLSTVDSLINFDMKSIIENRQISAEMKQILCDAFSKGMDSEGMDAMAKIWYALTCVVAPMRPDSVTYYETKIINVIQHVVTNFMITTSKEAVNLCVVQSSNPVLNFANQFTAAFTGSANCMLDVATMSGEHKLQEIKYITSAVKTSFSQKGKSLYYLPVMMITAFKLCNNYRLKYIEAVEEYRIANEAYESALMGINPTNEVPTNAAQVVIFNPRPKSRGKIRERTEE
jgi:hypothetical protein